MDPLIIRQVIKKTLIIIHDMLATTAALFGACYICFQDSEFLLRLPVLCKLLPFFILFSFFVLNFLQVYRSKWRFASLPDLSHIVQAALALTLALLITDYFLVSPSYYGSYFFGKKTIFTYFILEMFFLGSSRLLYRYFRYTHTQQNLSREDHIPTLLLGRANEIELALRAIEGGNIQRVLPKGALSYRSSEVGQIIREVPIKGTFQDIEEVIKKFAAQGIMIRRLIAMPSALTSEANPEELLASTHRLGLPLSRLSALGEKNHSVELLPFEIEDLLFRPTVTIDHNRVGSYISGKRVLVTGGGGSIGSEMCLRLAAFGAQEILVLENSEPSMNLILEKLNTLKSPVKVSGILADIRDRERIFDIVSSYKPDILIHASALKHVHYLEKDWEEGIKTNIFGSVNVTDAAIAAKIPTLVIISTDKAVNPVSILGVTKRFSEIYAQAMEKTLWHQSLKQKDSITRLVAVRFGNVLGSAGSVVPKFKEQIARGGPITVTHKDMVRYFMTIREAVDLVLTAASHADGEARSLDFDAEDRASVYVLKMGQPVRIYELAERMIRFAGMEPNIDIQIDVTGARPGERLNEILFASEEPMVPLNIDGVMAAKPIFANEDKIRSWLSQLEQVIHSHQRIEADRIFEEAVPEYKKRFEGLVNKNN